MYLDLWLSTIYDDPRVVGSDIGPIVYLRNGTGNPLLNCTQLAQRWGVSRATVSPQDTPVSAWNNGMGWFELIDPETYQVFRVSSLP